MFVKLGHRELTLLDACGAKAARAEAKSGPHRSPRKNDQPKIARAAKRRTRERANAGGTNFAVKVQTACAIDVYKRKRKFFSILFGALSVGPAGAARAI